jgi:ATP phosphoribosyltransferase
LFALIRIGDSPVDSPPEVRIALPSKGRLEGEVLEFLATCGLRVSKTNPRQYKARIPALPEVLILFQRVRDIPKSVASGDVDLGITGFDTVAEGIEPGSDQALVIHEDLGFGDCSLVVAVPEGWSDVNTAEDLAAKAKREGTLRVATKHTKLARQFLEEGAIRNIEIVSADGALEAAPSIGYADFIIDLSSTGTTLLDNHLKPLSNGTLLKSTAVLIGNRSALKAGGITLSTTLRILEFIEAHLRAVGQYMVFANMRGDSAEEVALQMRTQTQLGGLQGPTISPIIGNGEGSGWWAINIVVSSERLYSAVQELRTIGGSGVIVTPATYIFEESPARCQRLLATLGQAEVAQ